MTEAEARSAVEAACHRADVTLEGFGFWDLPMGNSVWFDGAPHSLSAGQSAMIVIASVHGRKMGADGGLQDASAARLEQRVYNFAVDWLAEAGWDEE